MDRNKILKMTVILAAIVVVAGSLSRLYTRNSMSLTQYAELHGVAESASEDSDAASASPEPASRPDESDSDASSAPAVPTADGDDAGTSLESEANSDEGDSDSPDSSPEYGEASALIGASLNGTSQLEERTVLSEGFYYEPVSDNLRRYMTGISYPAADSSSEEESLPEISFDELRYLHILHFDFDGEAVEGELICNELIAGDLAEIFQELYRNEYQIEKVLLIDEYEGDDTASMEDNNTSCFNYRLVEGSEHLSKHAYGLALDINPLYNPYITYTKDGEMQVSPASALPYADRSSYFPYKIDEDDLCYKLFTRYGFTWGGNWNSMKDYQHFQKTN